MIHPSTITLAQWILIALGMLFQFIALVTFMRDHDDALNDKLRAHRHDDGHGPYSEHDFHTGNQVPVPPPVALTTIEPPRMQAHASNLTSTSKVKFKQTFQFREHH